ncbi:MAG TPA: phospho-sugar mutase [Gemmataceae bacterium]|nr:phospho-sugar mutase [Gemmataceae bacterium]
MDLLTQARQGFQGVEADAALKDQALHSLRQWLSDPEFAPYRPQLEWLIQTGRWPGLLDRFSQILPFGTGGRRGAVGIGPNRMNLWTLAASVQGHCEYLKERFPDAAPIHIVLAYDVRRFEDQRKQYNAALPNPVLHLSSRDLARHAAVVYAANGLHAHILPPDSAHYLATPELSFTIRFLKAHGGLNISASHNPPDDNGGKFYDERGGQPVPPDDQIMADLVEQVTHIKALPWAEAVRSARIHSLDDAPHRAYIDLCRKQTVAAPLRRDEDFRIVFTPLHGVGALTAMRALEGLGFRILPVAEQMTPDGQFPNVTKTPNPEVPESMDRAAALAAQHKADLVLSTDPDADRLGAMAPDREGAWRYITGNQIAALLTHFKLSKLSQQSRLPASPIVVRTDVTTGQVTRIARRFGAQIIDDLLVGFKYIADVLWHLEQNGAYQDVSGSPADFVIGVEESHGILTTPLIRDKDAGGAAVLLADLALEQKRRGQTVLDYVDRLAREFGYYHNAGIPVFMTGVEGKRRMASMLDRLRAAPPREIGGLTVTRIEDRRDEERYGSIKGATDAASRNVLVFHFGERARVALRPSGTEPKAKVYLEVCAEPCPTGTSTEAWRKTCQNVDDQAKRLGDDFVKQALALIGLDPSAAGAR